MRFASALVLLVAGCASAPSAFMPKAAPQDDRAVVAEFCDSFYDDCRAFDQTVRPQLEASGALAKVRFVRFNWEDKKDAAAFDRFKVSALEGWTPEDQAVFGRNAGRSGRLMTFLVIVNDRAVDIFRGRPLYVDEMSDFFDTAAKLGGSERALHAAIDETPGSLPNLLRAATWYEAHNQNGQALSYWQRILPLVPDGYAVKVQHHVDTLMGKSARADRR
jgi:hypothetical protein